ncbi:MAG: hypothetical protein WBP85_09975, partial [Terracidiphilus sp.]
MGNTLPQGLKPISHLVHLAARLKPCPFKAAALAVVIVFAFATISCAAQTAPSTPQASGTNPSKSQVIFSRSTDANGETTSQTGPAATPVVAAGELTPPQDAERQAITF